ncbi:CDF family Co(II)/Ni(II) efflux transporter DmeF [Neisseria sp. Ec49-e6-T10]|uniref:CDF family Co(II)/Ni(II) efflux transporter DmeF n=1 Tax=Neisseria sp. Ec49-e6-T10 TaxID=3140744 RepID=UPI003EBDBEFD
MHTSLVSKHYHTHSFHDHNPLAERKTTVALWLTVFMMFIEILGGWYFNSMALLADGWHMSSHVLALGLAILAFKMSRKYANSPKFTFGTWKIEVLGSFSSALLLVVVAVFMFYESVIRLFSPFNIHYEQAIWIAIMGLLVNLICAYLLHDGEHHHHNHQHEHKGHHHLIDTHEHHHNLNLRAAYIHVIADAATSVLAIIALVCGKFFGAEWLDPVMGIVGAVLVIIWAINLLKASGSVLLDAEMDRSIVQEVKGELGKNDLFCVTDFHLWRVGQEQYACIVCVEIDQVDVQPSFIKEQLRGYPQLSHITVEVNVK